MKEKYVCYVCLHPLTHYGIINGYLSSRLLPCGVGRKHIQPHGVIPVPYFRFLNLHGSFHAYTLIFKAASTSLQYNAINFLVQGMPRSPVAAITFHIHIAYLIHQSFIRHSFHVIKLKKKIS